MGGSLPATGEPAADTAGTRGAWLRLAVVSRRAAKWVAAVLVISVVLPAVTKQWSDNQQQGQLKSDLTADLAAAVARATVQGGLMLADLLPPARPRGNKQAARRDYEDILVSWRSDASALEARITAYFATAADPTKDDLVQAMRVYNTLVQQYIGYCFFFEGPDERTRYLVGNADSPGFRGNLSDFRKYTAQAWTAEEVIPEEKVIPNKVWKTRSEKWSPPPPRTYERSDFKEKAVNDWADNIVKESVPLITMINQRQPSGFEVGAKAFFRQLLHPFG